MSEGDYSHRVKTHSVDEVGQLAAAFNSMAADLEEVDQQRRALIANVSHELRTPIAALQVQLENMIDGITERDDQAFGVMLRHTERLGRLVHQLLDLSRLEASSTRLEIEECDLGHVLSLAVEEHRTQDPSADIRLTVKGDVLVLADVERLRQVASNLIQNALRYGPSGTPIEVLARAIGDGVIFEVADSGPGIPTQEAELVFERFYRADGSHKAGGGGTGLGLAISKSIVELHSGVITAVQNAPQGCRMVVQLPRHQPERIE